MYVCMYADGYAWGPSHFCVLLRAALKGWGVSIQFWRKFRGGLSDRAFWLFEEGLGIVV